MSLDVLSVIELILPNIIGRKYNVAWKTRKQIAQLFWKRSHVPISSNA